MKVPNTLLVIFTIATSLTVFAQPGAGIRLDEFTLLVPRLNVSANYDDNVNLRGRALDEEGNIPPNESDTYIEYLVSLELYRVLEGRSLSASAYLGEDMYQDYSELDSEKYGASLGYTWASSSKKTKVDLSGSYQYAIDDVSSGVHGFTTAEQELEGFANVSDRVERDILTISTSLDQKIGTDLGTVFSFGMYDTDYAEEDFNDRTAFDYEAELNHQLSPKTQNFVRVGYGIDDDEGFAEDSENPFILVGSRYTVTNKMTVNASVGYESYTITPLDSQVVPDENGDPIITQSAGEEQDDDGFKYRLSGIYKLNPKTTISLSARNGYASQGTENSRPKRENALVLSLGHKTTDQFSQRVSVNWRDDDFLEATLIDDVEFDETRETLRYTYSFTYNTPRPWLSFFGRAMYEDGTSNRSDGVGEYDQTELSLGARLRY